MVAEFSVGSEAPGRVEGQRRQAVSKSKLNGQRLPDSMSVEVLRFSVRRAALWVVLDSVSRRAVTEVVGRVFVCMCLTYIEDCY